MAMKDITKPTKKYIAGLLESEEIIPTSESVSQALFGWLEAVKTPKAERERRTRAISEAVFWGADCEMIGYCTFTYLTMTPDLKHFEQEPKLRLL